MLVCASRLAQKELWSIVPIVFGYRTDVGAIGGRLLVVESFVDLVLIALLWPVPTSIWRLLPYRRTGANAAPAG